MTRLAFSVYRSNIKPYPSRVSQGEAVGACGPSPLKFSALWSIMQSRCQRCPSPKCALGTRICNQGANDVQALNALWVLERNYRRHLLSLSPQLVAITCKPELQPFSFVPFRHSSAIVKSRQWLAGKRLWLYLLDAPLLQPENAITTAGEGKVVSGNERS